MEQEKLGRLHPFIRQFEIHRAHLDRVGDVLDRAPGKPLIRLLDRLQIDAQPGNRVQFSDLVMHPVKDIHQPRLVRAGMAFETRGHCPLDRLRREQVMIAQRNVVVLAHQQGQNVDIILARLRPIHKKPRPGPLTQGIVHILGVVGEHAKSTVPPHHGVGPGKALHQHRRDLQLPRRGLPVAALARQLIDIVNRTETDHHRIDYCIDESLGVLARLSLIAVDIVGAEVLIAERIPRHLAIVVDQPRHHLDQRCLARPRFAIPHESKDKAAKFGKRVQFAVKIIRHQHLGQAHRLVFCDMISDNLVGLLECHRQGRTPDSPRRHEPIDRQIIRLDTPARPGKPRQPSGTLGTQGQLFHHLLGKGTDTCHQPRFIADMCGNILIQFPKHTMQRHLRIVGQHLLNLAHLDRGFADMRRQQKRGCIGKDMRHHKRLGAQQFAEFGLAITTKRPGKIVALQTTQPRRLRKGFADRQRNCQGTAQPVQNVGLHRRHQRIAPVRALHPGNQMHPFGSGRGPGDKPRRGGPKPPTPGNSGRAFLRPVRCLCLGDARGMIKTVQQGHSGIIVLANVLFPQLHLIAGQAHFSRPHSSFCQ